MWVALRLHIKNQEFLWGSFSGSQPRGTFVADNKKGVYLVCTSATFFPVPTPELKGKKSASKSISVKVQVNI